MPPPPAPPGLAPPPVQVPPQPSVPVMPQAPQMGFGGQVPSLPHHHQMVPGMIPPNMVASAAAGIMQQHVRDIYVHVLIF